MTAVDGSNSLWALFQIPCEPSLIKERLHPPLLLACISGVSAPPLGRHKWLHLTDGRNGESWKHKSKAGTLGLSPNI